MGSKQQMETDGAGSVPSLPARSVELGHVRRGHDQQIHIHCGKQPALASDFLTPQMLPTGHLCSGGSWWDVTELLRLVTQTLGGKTWIF